jgi:uncharacterized protein (TIGR02118 family)
VIPAKNFRRRDQERALPYAEGGDMIIRSGLICNRDGVDFAAFSDHWRNVHGPLALRVEAMRAYRQNHILERLPAPQSSRLHRVDGISQLWFDDVEAMRVAMESDEQRACVEDIRRFLSNVTILIQQEGEMRRCGAVGHVPVKFIYLLSGSETSLMALADGLCANFAAGPGGADLRVNPIINRDFAVDPTVSAGGQIIDAVVEIWLPEGTDDAVARRMLDQSPDIGVVGAFRVNELILKKA